MKKRKHTIRGKKEKMYDVICNLCVSHVLKRTLSRYINTEHKMLSDVIRTNIDS